jgi:hypothetical protein
MAPPSLVGAVTGGLIAGVLPNRVLLGAISVFVLLGAVEVARYRRPQGQEETPVPSRRGLLVNAALVGFGVGLLGGFVGLILGSLRLPALVKYAGVTPYAAVGTNAAVGMVVGIGGLIGHLPSGVDWGILAAGAAAAMPARTSAPASPAASTRLSCCARSRRSSWSAGRRWRRRRSPARPRWLRWDGCRRAPSPQRPPASAPRPSRCCSG